MQVSTSIEKMSMEDEQIAKNYSFEIYSLYLVPWPYPLNIIILVAPQKILTDKVWQQNKTISAANSDDEFQEVGIVVEAQIYSMRHKKNVREEREEREDR